MLPQEIIRNKRDGSELSKDQINSFIQGVTADLISDAQVAAFLMAVYLNGMSSEETVALTLAMRDSGDVLNWSDSKRTITDKHSTGGIGDNISLMLAPVVAACGLAVPMISGRGLGHTGGTLDKLESIAGYKIQQNEAELKQVIRDVGCAIVGQTSKLAPADKRLYAVRDITATVESLPLITASILSKKLASGLQSLVLDVKYGSGSFMAHEQDAVALATALVDVANQAGVKTTALLTDMNEPLADSVGNSVEIANCLDFLKGQKNGTRQYVVLKALATEMLLNSGLTTDVAVAEAMIDNTISSGQALSVFGHMVHALGGPKDFIEKSSFYLPKTKFEVDIVAQNSGLLSACDGRAIGMMIVELGGGRKQVDEIIDHAVGLTNIQPLGSRVEKGDAIARLHIHDKDIAESLALKFSRLWTIDDRDVSQRPIILRTVN